MSQHENLGEQPARRFTEAPQAEPVPRRKRRRRWDDEGEAPPESEVPAASKPPPAPAVAEGAEVSPKLAAESEYEALRHLVDAKVDKKDSYSDAVERGGIIEGGTWEHRKRAKEMVHTAELTATINRITAQRTASGVASYLPPEIRKAVEENLSSLTPVVAAPTLEDIAEPKLDESNKGYQLLKRAGWKEGEGLGASGTGTVAPISASSQTYIPDPGASVSPEAATGEGREFDAFRKRMMLAYKFRPNPLNNPRRSYDGYSSIYDNSLMASVMQRLSTPGSPSSGNQIGFHSPPDSSHSPGEAAESQT